MLSFVLACASASERGADGGNEQTGAGDDSATAGSTSDSGAPAYWTLDASLDVAAGTPRLGAASMLTFALLDSGLEPTCTTSLPVESAVSKTSPDEAIFSWWLLAVDRDSRCDAGVESVLLGIGELNADVEAVFPSTGYDAADASALNGAYYGADAKTEWAFGVAGFDSSFKGDGEALDGPPIADGVWLVRALFPFPI
jgi:hypothetical protein